jgi:hypothetical protein
MNLPLTACFITPSYAPDFERCRLLCESIEKFVSPKIPHYIIVDQRDLALFRKLQNSYTSVITKESILPWWIWRIPFLKNSWFTLKTPPIRGWLLQQLIKIGIAHHINEDILIFVDSDVAFIRSFQVDSIICNGQVRIFSNPESIFSYMETHQKWYDTAAELIGIEPIPFPATDYIVQLAIWRRNNVLKLCDHLEKVSGKSWIETLGSVWNLSEYVLYGLFVESILKEQSGHYYDPQDLCHPYWRDQPLSELELQQFFDQIQPHHVAIMISAKAGMSVQQYQELVRQINSQASVT